MNYEKAVVVLRKQKYRSVNNFYRIRVSGEIYERLESLSGQTNMSTAEIATKLLDFALERVVVEGGDDK